MNKILEIRFGSHLFGTNTPNSDLDFKGIYLPTAREIVLNNYKRTITTTRPKREYERNTKDDIDIEIFSLDRYLELLVEGQTVALDMFFAPPQNILHLTVEGQRIISELEANKMELLNRNVNAFVGYAKAQAAKYGQKGFRVHALRAGLEWLNLYPDHMKIFEIGHDAIYRWIAETGNEHIKIVQCKAPNGRVEDHLELCDKKYPFHATVKYVKVQLQRKFDEYGRRALMAEKNEGVDWKALSHAVRVNAEAKELLTVGEVTLPRPERELLLKIKTGQLPYKEVANMIEVGLEELKEASEKSSLRDAPNQAWVDDFVYRIYSEIVKNG